MATIDTDLVDRELRAIISTSNIIKKQLYDALERMEQDPSVFEELGEVHPAIQDMPNLVAIRKVVLTHRRHDFRIVFAHWTLEDESEHCDLLLAFPRRSGYKIDWSWVDRVLRSRRK